MVLWQSGKCGECCVMRWQEAMMVMSVLRLDGVVARVVRQSVYCDDKKRCGDDSGDDGEDCDCF